MTGHRATVTVGGVRWELHADGSRTATVYGVSVRAAREVGEAWGVRREDTGRTILGRRVALSEMARKLCRPFAVRPPYSGLVDTVVGV